MPKITAVGIDLGTTYSAMARLDETGRTAMLRNAQGDLLTPSVVLFEDKEIVVGKEAKKALSLQPDRVAECVKRDMGAATYSKPIRGERLPPEVIQSCILRKLRQDAVVAVGNDIKVVITVPAYFDEPRRKATADAGEMAGLDVLDIVNEPTAAALAFGEQLGYLDPTGAPRQAMRVLVYDLGGGTFDVTVLDMQSGNLRTLATDGDVRLGGLDWDSRIVDFVSDVFRNEHGVDPRKDQVGSSRLFAAAEEAKHTLSARDQANVHFEFGGKTCDVQIARSHFEELTEDLLERTSHTTRQVLSSAGLEWKDISHVLLTGGSTRMPMVSKMLAGLSKVQPNHTVNPDEAVARGAAIYAGYLLALRDTVGPGPAFKVTDVNAHSLGIEGIDQKTSRKENIVLIPRNSSLPQRVTESFVTKAADQKTIVVQVLEGESKMPDQCTKIARAVMRQIPGGLPKGWPIEVTYEYGTNGRLSVRAHVPGTPSDLRIELEREQGLSDEHVSRWKQVVTSDKGFDAFESMLDNVLDISGPAAQKPAAAAPGRTGTATPVGETRSTPIPISKPAAAAANPAAANPAAPTRLQTSPIAGASGAATATLSGGKPVVPTARSTTAHSDAADDEHKTSRMVIAIVAQIAVSTVGLSLAYYLLCLITPQANFLNLSLPGVAKPPANQQPMSPTNHP